MTEQEKKIKRYVNAIERELRLPLKAKARINGDIGTDIHARLEKGQSIDEIIAEMGTPQEVAAGFNEEMQDQLLPKGSPWRWVFLIAAILAGGAALLSILLFLLFYFQSSGMGVIGGADGPTAIFITGAANLLAPVLTPLWLTKQDKSEPYASWRRVRICCFYPLIGLRRNGTGFSCATACRKRSPIGGLFLVSEEGMRYNGVGR